MLFRNPVYTLACVLFCAALAPAQAQTARLNFSDLDGGPNSGGENSGGVYVTLYGTNFGAAQGTSSVTVGGAPALRYPSWTNTKVVLQIGAANASGSIQVVTGAGTSNAIPFTVRAGNIYFVAANGSDSASGRAGSPWRTVQSAVDKAIPGDVIYVMNGISEARGGSSDGSVTFHNTSGAEGRPIALVAYPGAIAQIGSLGTGTCTNTGCVEGIRAWDTSWWTVAGLRLYGIDYGIAMTGGTHFRVVGNDISCPFGDGAGACVETGGAQFISVYGNNVHDAGQVRASALYHGVYFSTDGNQVDFGWNIIANVRGCRGLQTHSSVQQAGSGLNMFDISIHDNIIHDTQCDGIVLATVDPSKGKVEVFNNVIYNAGQGPNNPEGTGDWACVYAPGSTNRGNAGGGTIEVFNNTMYNCGSHPNPPYPARAGVSNGGVNPNLTIRIRNNIINTPAGVPYINADAPVTGSNNLFFGSGAVPAGFTSSLNSDPLFVNLAARDFRLTTGSPARGAGVNTGLTYDFDGVVRGSSVDIGAFQSSGSTGGGGGGGGGGGTPVSNLILNQQSLSFIHTLGTAAPGGVDLVVTNTGTASASWTASATQPWIALSQTSGTLAAGAAVTLIVTPVVTGLAANTYSGTITVSGGGNGAQTAGVALVINPAAVPVPTISAVTNAASYQAPPLSPGEIISVFGTNLGPATGVGATASGGVLPTTLGGVRLLVNDVPAPLLYVGASQINAIMPLASVSLSSAEIKVQFQGQTSATVTAQMSGGTSPGVFTLDYTGKGQGVVINQNGTLNTVSTPAAKGSLVSIYVDGLGATTPAFTDGQITSGTGFRVQASMSVTIGGADAPVGFAGLAPGAPAGVYRIDVTVPAGSATGTVPMIVTGGFVPAGTVTMAVQ